MRKVFYYFTPSGWLLLGLLVCLVIVIATGCGHISFKAPTTQIFAKGLAYEAGLVIGEDVALAKEFLEYTQIDRKDLDTFYPSWKRYLASKLIDKPRYQRLIRLALSSVDVRLEFKTSDEQNKIIKELFREFRAGLQAGIKSHN